MLVLDDLHWADAASLELVAHLLPWPPARPVLVVLAYRSNQAAGELLVAVAAAAREGSLAQVELDALGESDAEELLGDIDVRSRAAIYRESGGNPFYLEELARAHRAGPQTPVGWADDLDERGVPVGVRVVIEQEELARLSERAWSVLRSASVVGDPFDPAIAAAVAEVNESEASAALDEAAAFGARAAHPGCAHAALSPPDRAPHGVRERRPGMADRRTRAPPSPWPSRAHRPRHAHRTSSAALAPATRLRSPC